MKLYTVRLYLAMLDLRLDEHLIPNVS
jgi:hypothetical protein